MSALPGWWEWAEAQCARLSAPDDAAAEDRVYQALWHDSWLGQRTRSLGTRLGAAWNDSITRAVARWFTHG